MLLNGVSPSLLRSEKMKELFVDPSELDPEEDGEQRKKYA